MADEAEQAEIRRRITAGIFSRRFELAIAGGARADGLVKRIADDITKNYVISVDDFGNAIVAAGDQRSHCSRDSLDALVRNEFKNSSEFAEESAVWQEKHSHQIGFNPKTVTGLFPKPATPTETPAQMQARSIRGLRQRVSGAL